MEAAFVARYFALCRLEKYLPVELVDSVEKQEALLARCGSAFAMPYMQREALLEAIVRTCESEKIEVAEAVYEQLAEHHSMTAEQKCNEHVFGKFTVPRGDVLFHAPEDASALVQKGSTGFITWEAGKCLSWYLSCVYPTAGSWILELGCGTGISGIVVISSVPVAHYTFSDYHESTLMQAKANWEINRGTNESMASFKQIDFLNDCGFAEADLIVAADILYDVPLCEGLVAFLTRSHFREALIMTTIRTESTHARFIQYLSESSELRWQSVRKMKTSEWLNLPDDDMWRSFLTSAPQLLDPDLELISILRCS